MRGCGGVRVSVRGVVRCVVWAVCRVVGGAAGVRNARKRRERYSGAATEYTTIEGSRNVLNVGMFTAAVQTRCVRVLLKQLYARPQTRERDQRDNIGPMLDRSNCRETVAQKVCTEFNRSGESVCAGRWLRR